MPSVDEILKKYSAKIEREIATEPREYSSEYRKFKEETLPSLTRYERLCQGMGKVFRVRPSRKDKEKINKAFKIAHLDIEAKDAYSFSFFLFLIALIVPGLLMLTIYLWQGTYSLLLIFLFFFFAIFLFYYSVKTPERIAQSWRLKASSQMVPCILYIVVYMRHTSNLERAIRFASEHLQAPLALDFKKIFYDVEIGKYTTIKESLEAYLETWRDYSMEFIEAFHLIESSLFEPSDARRVEILEKSLEVILDGIHEKMLHYTHDVKAPLTNLYMLGIVLPTLAIALLPLVSALMGGNINWIHVAIIFNLLVPFLVFYLTSQVLAKRPGGYGETELLEQNPDYYIYASKSHYYTAFFLVLPFIILALLPLIFYYTSFPELIGLQKDFTVFGMKMFDFQIREGKVTGPFGIGALFLSMLFPIAIAIFFSVVYKGKTSKLIETRKGTKQLEQEFASSLFQLGNRVGEGMPLEIAFGRVAESVRGTATESFFRIVNSNVNQGMSVDSAIFDRRRGSIIYYPSTLIRTSMKILIESAKKSLQASARALMSISQYVKNIHKINERLRDLLADVVSDMRSNMTFLAPILAGIVVGLSMMITSIFIKLSDMIREGTLAGGGVAGLDISSFMQNFDVAGMLPPYYLQMIVGIYLIEIIFILTSTLVTVESGVDKLSEKAETAKNLKYGMLLYFFISLLATIALAALSYVAIGGITS